MLHSDRSVDTNTSIDYCASTPAPIERTDELPPDSLVSFFIASAILLRAVTGLIQVLLSAKRQKTDKE